MDSIRSQRHWRGRAFTRGLLALFIAVAVLAAFPAWAFKAGEGADDIPAGLPEYVNVAAYLADQHRNDHRNIKIGDYILEQSQVERFHQANGLTDDNLIESYADVASYLADSERASRLYAEIGGVRYLVVNLEALNNAGTLSDRNLPRPERVNLKTTAVGRNAKAIAYDATAFGHNALAAGDAATAVGEFSNALGHKSTALGDHAHAHGDRAQALGADSRAYGDHATALGQSADSYGEDSTALGQGAFATKSSTAVGRGALAAKDYASGSGALIECAHHPRYDDDFDSFIGGCERFFTEAERQDSRLAQDDDAGQAFRQGIRSRLQGILEDLSVSGATAVGRSARATDEYATAIGTRSRATGNRSTALGSVTHAAGDRSTAVGRAAYVTGEDSIGVGHIAQAHGDEAVALGKGAGAGAWVATRRYTNASAYLADPYRASFGRPYAVIAGSVYSIPELEAIGSSLTDATLPEALGDASKVIFPERFYSTVEAYLDDSNRTDYSQVFIGRNVYDVTELEAVSNLTEDSLPNPLQGAFGAVAVGVGAQAPARRAMALGHHARAVGPNAIAIGPGVTAGENQVVIGLTEHSYRLPGVAASQTEDTEVLTVDDTGQLAADGGDLYRRVEVLENNHTALANLGTPEDTADEEGSAFARIASMKQNLGSVQDALGTAEDEPDQEGSAFARIASVKEDLGTSGDTADTGDSAFSHIDSVRQDLTNTKTAIETAFGTLLELLRDQTLSGEQTVGEDGNPVGTTMAEFQGLDAAKGNAVSSKERLAYLFQALYGKPYSEEGMADPATDSDTPHENSIAGRLDSAERGELRNGGYEEAPAVGSGGSAPANAGNRRVVVQDTNRDGSVKLRTMDLPGTAALERRMNVFDKRVTALDERLEGATAMSSALSALPNVVPNGGKLFLGAGLGHYGGKQALAVGLSARLGDRKNIFVNAGVATTTGGDSVSARGGIGFVW